MSFFRWGVLMALIAGVADGQTVLRRPPQGALVDGRPAYAVPLATREEVLQEMAERAAVIFAGTVAEVRLPGEGGGVVEVVFAVSDAVRGVAGGMYVVREWAGLWRDGARYRVGDRRLMLLHAPGPGGLSSPVDGMDGAIPVVSGGVVAAAMRVGPVGESVDLRWLEAKTLRGGGYEAEGQVAAHVLTAPAAEEVKPSLARMVGFLTELEARRNAGR